MGIAHADLIFRIRFLEAGRLPAFRGTTLRGALGFALKRTVCIVSHRDCARCFLRSRCAFPNVFEGVPPASRTFMRKYPYVPQPFVLRVAPQDPIEVRADDLYEFGIRLFGPAIDFFPYVVMAIERMGQAGLGRDRLPFEVVHVSDGRQVIHDRTRSSELSPPQRSEVSLPTHGGAGHERVVTVRLVTPLRLRVDGSVSRTPGLADIVRAAVRRFRILHEFCGDGALPTDLDGVFRAVEAAQPEFTDVREFCVRRRSARQGVGMLLDGVLGEMRFAFRDSAFLSWLLAAQELHVGKATSFGFGRISCEVADK